MASKKEYATRFGMGILALLFLVTSIGFSLLVIWQVKEKNKQEAALQSAASQQDTASKEGKLEGTKLQNFTPVASVPSVQSTDLVVGTGAEVKPGDTITAHYTGALAKDGTIFQSSLDTGQPFTRALGELIKGWQEGIPGMKVGGTRRLLIPAALAYGDQAQNGIPANSDLVFDIQLLNIGAQ